MFSVKLPDLALVTSKKVKEARINNFAKKYLVRYDFLYSSFVGLTLFSDHLLPLLLSFLGRVQ